VSASRRTLSLSVVASLAMTAGLASFAYAVDHGVVSAGLAGLAGGTAAWLGMRRGVPSQQEERNRRLLSVGSGACLFTWAPDDSVWFSDGWVETFDIPSGAHRNAEVWLDRVHPEDFGALLHGISAVRSGESQVLRQHYRIRRGEDWLWFDLHARRVEEDGASVVTGAAQDVTLAHSMQTRLAHSAFHDPLTGLPNRALFLDRLEHSTARARRNPLHRFAVVFVDVDNFKVINDSLGHHAGDELLDMVAKRLAACARSGDTVARIGGDEFTVLLEPVDSPDDADKVAQRLRHAVHGSVVVAGHPVEISTSVGIAFSSPDYTDALDLLRDADTAMYYAKRAGPGNQRRFDQAMHESAKRRLSVEAELRRGLEGEGLLVYYQPIVSLVTGQLDGFEALVRLSASNGALISPAEFIPLAESQGLIDKILDRVLADSTARLAEWSKVMPDLYVSVNVSARSVGAGLVARVRDALAVHDLRTDCIKLELTESVLVEPSSQVAQSLVTLGHMGVGLFIDDFGTGYSSLAYLHQFPVSRIKLDRTFVMALDGDHVPEIVETIVTLSASIGAKVIAEGIETPTQLEALVARGCSSGQGFLFAPALPGDKAAQLVHERRAWPLTTASRPVLVARAPAASA
jgi:diguanylate cyclase (GGDEF)-like protein